MNEFVACTTDTHNVSGVFVAESVVGSMMEGVDRPPIAELAPIPTADLDPIFQRPPVPIIPHTIPFHWLRMIRAGVIGTIQLASRMDL